MQALIMKMKLKTFVVHFFEEDWAGQVKGERDMQIVKTKTDSFIYKNIKFNVSEMEIGKFIEYGQYHGHEGEDHYEQGCYYFTFLRIK